MLLVSPVGPVSGSKSHRRWPDARARELGRADARCPLGLAPSAFLKMMWRDVPADGTSRPYNRLGWEGSIVLSKSGLRLSRRMFRTSFAAAAVAAISCFVSTGVRIASAAEIKFLCAAALVPAIPGLVVEFEKTSGHTVTVTYATVGALTDRLQKGEAADVAIVSGPQIDELQKSGKVVAGSRVDITKVGVGVFARKGAAKPDISSVGALKRSLLAAKAIAYPDPAGGGAAIVYLVSLFDRLGIAAEMKPKTKLLRGPSLYASVASGEVEIGFQMISEILAEPSVEFIGPLPPAIQNITQYAAGIIASSTQADAGKALVGFLSSPASVAVMKAKGFE
jgi:molybdate transport system substrate-binding protein